MSGRSFNTIDQSFFNAGILFARLRRRARRTTSISYCSARLCGSSSSTLGWSEDSRPFWLLLFCRTGCVGCRSSGFNDIGTFRDCSIIVVNGSISLRKKYLEDVRNMGPTIPNFFWGGKEDAYLLRGILLNRSI